MSETTVPKPNVISLQRKVLIHIPITETERVANETKIKLSENTMLDMERQIYAERGLYHEVVGVSEGITAISVGDWVKFVLPGPTPQPGGKPPIPFQPETFYENDTRYINIPEAYCTAKIADVKKYVEMREAEKTVRASEMFGKEIMAKA